MVSRATQLREERLSVRGFANQIKRAMPGMKPVPTVIRGSDYELHAMGEGTSVQTVQGFNHARCRSP